MLYGLTNVKFLKPTILECTFLDGKIIQYDVSNLFDKYPVYKGLADEKVFKKGVFHYGWDLIYWGDIDEAVDTATIYEDGTVVGHVETTINQKLGFLLSKVREEKEMSQTELAKLSHIDQADISRIELAEGNPTLKKIDKLFKALGKTITIDIE